MYTYMYFSQPLHTYLQQQHFHTLSSRLGIKETIYHLFHYASFHSAKDKWTIIFEKMPCDPIPGERNLL